MIQAFPIQWPLGYKRTIIRKPSKFNTPPEKAQLFLRNEIKLLGAIDLIVSSNVVPRKDGLLYYDMSSSKIDDPGVAIYFKYHDKDVSMCCDQYLTPIENLYALAKGIEALRGMERWGVSEFIDRAFTGFAALPESKGVTVIETCWSILGIEEKSGQEAIKKAYRDKAKISHPDTGGSTELFNKLTAAFNEAMDFWLKG